MTGVVVRPAVPDDLAALGRCHLECWREAYGDLVDPARLAPYLADVDEFVGRWRRALGEGASHVRIAQDAGDLVGFASVRPAAGGRPAHLLSLYVRRAYWGTGLGQRLLDAVLGDEPATLDVLRDNVRARRFYARNGFVPDGTETEEPRLGGVEIGLVRPAPTPDPTPRRMVPCTVQASRVFHVNVKDPYSPRQICRARYGCFT